MKKTLFKIFLSLALANINTVFAFCNSNSDIEFRTAAFFPSSHRFKEIYGDAAASYQLETSTPFKTYLTGWANADWITKNGRSVGLGDSTNVNIFNFSLGIKVPYQLNDKFNVYLGLGPSFGGIWIKNHTHCIKEKASKTIFGGVVKSGIHYLVTESFFVDVFLDYLYEPVHFDTRMNIGGLKTGIGIGINFP